MPKGSYQQTPEWREKRIAAFWKKVRKSKGCWTWTGTLFFSGYGLVHFCGRMVLAHRMSWELVKGEIPADMQVLHECDNRVCCNPDHLFLGTQADNIRDMHEKGRAPIGETHGCAKLTETEVRAIRSEHKFRVMTYAMLAQKYGLAKGHVAKIVRGEAWSHLD